MQREILYGKVEKSCWITADREVQLLEVSKSHIFVNGRIFTADDENMYADSMIVEEGTVKWVGKRESAPPCAYETVDLEGKRVIPGFVDAHMHPVMLADYSRQISALPPKVSSIEELVGEMKRARASQGPEGWIEGWGYDEGKFAEKRSITRHDLDRGCSDAPVSIIRSCGHIRCVNSKALELAGIDRNTPDPQGGEIEKDADGEPTGVLKENARNLILPFMPPKRREEKVRGLIELGKLLTSQGIVAVADMGNLEKEDNYPLYLEASKNGFKQEVAVYYMWEYYMEDGSFELTPEKLDKNRQIFAAGLKLIGDGSVSGRTAWMSRPYLGTADEYGISVCTEQQMETAIEFCKKLHCQLSVHAMGGSAISHAVDRVYAEGKWTMDETPHVRIEHVTDPSEDSIGKAAEKGIGFATQPIFLYAEIESYLKNLGEEWMEKCYPVRHMLDRGVNLCFSTDAPATSWAEPSNPFPSIKAAVTRTAYDKTSCGREQAVDIETAVKLYTREAARMAGFKRLGQIKEGYKADFIILDQDILIIPAEKIDTVQVEKTYINGVCESSRF